MAGLRGNQAWLAFAKQSAKGTAATVALPAAGVPGTYKVPFSGGNISPVRSIDQLAETDANRDQGVSFARTGGVEGSPEIYVRDKSIGAVLAYAFGGVTGGTGGSAPSDVPTGSAPVTHVLTPKNVLPYVTFWRSISDTLWEEYRDCFVSSVTVRAGAGDPLSAAVSVNGLQSTRLATDPTITPAIPLESQYVYNYNDATVNLSGGSSIGVSSFEVTIDNNVTRQQADSFLGYDVVAGQRTVTLSFDLIFENMNEYNLFHYGATGGVNVTNAIYTTAADFQFDNGTNQVKFTLPTIAYEEFPVEPNTGGDPIVASIRAVAQRPVSGPIITATVKNTAAVYF